MSAALNILVIRRDNIGDLVCTTPVFTALRQRFPSAQICALVNSYNAPVLARSTHVDRVLFTPSSSIARPANRGAAARQRLRMHRTEENCIRLCAVANDQPRLLRFALGLRPKRIVALGQSAAPLKIVTMLPPIHAGEEHETQAVFRLLAPLGIEGNPPAVSIVPDRAEREKAQTTLTAKFGEGLIVGIHVSARKPNQRWPSERFAALMRVLHARHGLRFMLLWAPGSESNPLHPGDDEKAQAILQMVGDLPVLPYPTHTLPELIGALSICDTVICSDGGAMHLAAGLGKPIVCLFGKSDAWRWHPWGVPYELLQPASLDVSDISVPQVVEAYVRLQQAGAHQLTALR